MVLSSSTFHEMNSVPTWITNTQRDVSSLVTFLLFPPTIFFFLSFQDTFLSFSLLSVFFTFSVSSQSPMIESDIHDLSDDADYAASQQQGSASVMVTSDSTKQGSSIDLDAAEIVFLKDNVAIHPTQFASERISGRMKLIKQSSSLFMTWIPYKAHSSDARLSDKDRSLYTISAVSFTDIRSIRRHTPALGWQYIIVVLSTGLAYPPLYFYSGGVKEFLATIKQHVLLVRSSEDANVFLVNDFQNTLQRTLSSLELPRAVTVACGPSNLSGDESARNENEEKADGGVNNGIVSASQFHGRPRHKSHDPARDISIHVLEKFSLVTKFARETTSQLFGENQSNGFSSSKKRIHIQTNLDHPKKSPNIEGNVLDESHIIADPLEFDKLSLVWGKPRQPPLGSEEWITFLDSEGRVTDSEALRKRIFYGGLDHNLRNEVWGLLLGYYSYESTYAGRKLMKSVKKSEYETIKNQWQSISLPQAKRFTKFRERKCLIEKDVVRTDRSLAFYEGDDNPNVNVLRDILLTFSFYNFDLGYCQGMSDLLSPILFVMGDESEAFWCFVALMERLGPNFNRDQNGMHSQLFALSKLVELLDSPLHNYFEQGDCLNYFFCFRWILIQFKRDFEYESTMRLWEVLWTYYLSEHMHLYICVAILKRYRNKIMGEGMDFDTLLKFINELSGHIELDATLRDAEALCICAGENGAANIPPGTPPSLPLHDASFYVQQDDNEVL
ncbi:putative Rab-GTPase-TBC domain-containing protein [Lupinus albus]|uniref:TBC1 domain family member 15 n=1 Tax=Lupinus albus TaxID=3870 RepID=A0A6A4PL96_LUPAL|nr:putative Rab-GTPase-TBC domain-containing protein [Lupinus albus]